MAAEGRPGLVHRWDRQEQEEGARAPSEGTGRPRWVVHDHATAEVGWLTGAVCASQDTGRDPPRWSWETGPTELRRELTPRRTDGLVLDEDSAAGQALGHADHHGARIRSEVVVDLAAAAAALAVASR